MTKEEINKVVGEWLSKRHKLACPMVNGHCMKEKCRFWMPDVIGKVIGPNLPLLLSLEWACMFDQFNDRLLELHRQGAPSTRPPETSKGPGIFLPPGFDPAG